VPRLQGGKKQIKGEKKKRAGDCLILNKKGKTTTGGGKEKIGAGWVLFNKNDIIHAHDPLLETNQESNGQDRGQSRGIIPVTIPSEREKENDWLRPEDFWKNVHLNNLWLAERQTKGLRGPLRS